MMNFCKKTGILLLTLCAGIAAIAQTVTYKVLSEELKSIQKELVPDKRVAILEIELKDTLQPFIVLSGETNLPDAKKQINQFLSEKKIAFIDSMRLLPDTSVGDKNWALATLSVANIRFLPDHSSELVSQVEMGTPLKVLDYKDKWYRVQTPEYYIGWMDSSGLETFTASEIDKWKKSERFFYNQLSGYAYDRPDSKGNIVTNLALGDLFEAEATTKGFLSIKLPDGRTGYVHKKECISFEKWSNQSPNVNSILNVASRMMGMPYLWGGTSGNAADCSGFVKTVFYSQGVILARDASQQARYGEPINIENKKNLQPGDLLFFGRSAQRVTHVGIYIGSGDFIHSSGRVHISSIDPGDPKYVPSRNLVAARRILTSIGNEGIERVKEHKWYALP